MADRIVLMLDRKAVIVPASVSGRAAAARFADQAAASAAAADADRIAVEQERDAVDAAIAGWGPGTGLTMPAASRAVLAGASSPSGPAYLYELGREGEFVWSGANLSADVTADPRQVLTVPPTATPSGASGAWQRRYWGPASIKWTGAAGDGATDDTAALDAAWPLAPAWHLPAGTYVVSTTALPAGRVIATDGLNSRIKQKAGTAAGIRMVHLGGNSRIGDMGFEGQLGTDPATEYNAAIFAAGNATNGGLALTSLGNVTGTNIAGDVAYIGGPYDTIGTATITIATPGVVTRAAHGLANGTEVRFSTTGALPTGLSPYTSYYVVNATADTFELAATKGGASIATSGSQSGTHTLYASRYGVSQLSLGHVRASNAYRHGVAILGNSTAIDIASIIAGSAGIRALDIEPDHPQGHVKGVRVGHVEGRSVAVVAGGIRATGIDLGMVDLHPSNYGSGSTPAYPWTLNNGFEFRNADIRMGKLLASDFNGQALIGLAGSTVNSFVSIDNAEVVNCNRSNAAGVGYIRGGGVSAYTHIYRFGFLRARTDTSGHYVITEGAGSSADYAEVALVTGSTLAHGDDIRLQTINVTKADTGNGGTVVYSSTRPRVFGGKAVCDRFFNYVTRGVVVGADITATTAVDSNGTNNSFWASRLNGTFYFLYANGGTLTIDASGNVNLPSGSSYRVAGTQVVGARRTGWTAATGAPSRGAFAAAAAGTASAAYVQAELQAALNRIAALEARLIALEADMRAHGLIN